MRISWQDSNAADFTSITAFRQALPVANILTVDGFMYHGECSQCGALILGAERYREYELGQKLCGKCL